MRKRNEQVTKFFETIYEEYANILQNSGHSKPLKVYLWTDNCREQFKNKFQFGWGSRFLSAQKLEFISMNYFAPGHGKGICDSEGGIAKHAVGNAALHDEKFRNAVDLYKWLVANGGVVQSKTP